MYLLPFSEHTNRGILQGRKDLAANERAWLVLCNHTSLAALGILAQFEQETNKKGGSHKICSDLKLCSWFQR